MMLLLWRWNLALLEQMRSRVKSFFEYSHDVAVIHGKPFKIGEMNARSRN